MLYNYIVALPLDSHLFNEKTYWIDYISLSDPPTVIASECQASQAGLSFSSCRNHSQMLSEGTRHFLPSVIISARALTLQSNFSL